MARGDGVEKKDGFWGLPAPLMSALGTVLGFALLGGLDMNQQNVLGNWLELIGQVLETNSAQLQLLQSRQQGDRLEAVEGQTAALRRELEDLRQRLENRNSKKDTPEGVPFSERDFG